MQPRKFGFIFFIFLFLFISNTSVLGVDFVERAHFNEDGSGEFSIKVDLTKHSNYISVINYIPVIKNLYIYNDITKFIGYNPFVKVTKQFKKIADITQVCVKCNDEKMLIFELKFNFNTIQALNKAIRKINKGLDPPKITYFSMNDDLFVRQDINGIAQKVLLYQEAHQSSSKIASIDLAYFFKEATYTTVYTFYKEIENYSNPLSELAKDKKSIRITHHVFAPDEVEHSIGNRIHFVKK